MKIAVGIDVGGSSCSVAVSQHGKTSVVANDIGDRSTPSVVSFTPEDTLVGQPAEIEAHRNLTGTISGFPLLLGADASHPHRAALVSQVSPAPTEDTAFEVTAGAAAAKKVTCDPVELTGKVIASLAETASAAAGEPATACVVSVPSHATMAYRADLVRAASTVGVEVVQMLPAAVSAVIALGHTEGKRRRKDDEEDGDDEDGDAPKDALEPRPHCVAVVDIGTTMEVTLVEVNGGLCSVKCSEFWPQIGGHLFDEVLVEHFASEFEFKHNKNPRGNAKAMRKLLSQCRDLKIALSNAAQGGVSVDSFLEGIDLHSTVNRGRFEGMSGRIFTKITEALNEFLDKFELELDDIDEVILAGGCCNIPRVQKDICDVFDLNIVPEIAPEEIAAHGAAVQAAYLASHGGITKNNADASGSEKKKKGKGKKKGGAADASVVTPLSASEAASRVEKHPLLHGSTESSAVTAATVRVGSPDGLALSLLPAGTPLNSCWDLDVPIPRDDKDAAPEAVAVTFYLGESEKIEECTPIAEVTAAVAEDIATDSAVHISALAHEDGSLHLSIIAGHGAEPQNIVVPAAEK